MKAKLWIARDTDGELYLYKYKPILDRLGITYLPSSGDMTDYIEIDKNSHPEITFENSPQQIEI